MKTMMSQHNTFIVPAGPLSVEVHVAEAGHGELLPGPVDVGPHLVTQNLYNKYSIPYGKIIKGYIRNSSRNEKVQKNKNLLPSKKS